MKEFSEFLLADLDKDTVNFTPNYDNKELEPVVLPAKIPQLLANGASGIAVGMATNIPPHNLREIIGGLVALIQNPSISIRELMEHIPGPDFPTSGEIHGLRGIQEAYLRGRGRLLCEQKPKLRPLEKKGARERIIVTEIPLPGKQGKADRKNSRPC